MTQQLKHKIFSIANVDLVLFAGFMLSFFLHYRINGFMAMLIIIFGLVKLITRNLSFRGGGGLLFFPGIFILLILGQLYTSDLKEGWVLIERNLSLLTLPFAVASIVRFDTRKKRFLIRVFIAGGVLAGLVCLGIAFINSYETGSVYVIPNNTHFLYNRFMHHRLTDPIGLHAVYYSVYIALANVYLLHHALSGQQNRSKRIISALTFCFFLVLLYLLKSANIAFGFALVTLLVIGFRYGKSVFQSKVRTLLFTTFIFLIGTFAYVSITSKLESFTLPHNMSDRQLTPMQIRLSIWECSLEVISENWLLGTGTGDSQHELMQVYRKNNFVIGYENDFNAHNMYLQYWMSNGLAALSLFLIGLFILFRKALRHKNVVFLSFVILFALFSFSESTLRTQKGMLFFVFFAALFYWCPTLWSAKTEKI